MTRALVVSALALVLVACAGPETPLGTDTSEGAAYAHAPAPPPTPEASPPAPSPASNGALTVTTYANDPRIVAARTLAEAIDAKIGRGALAKSSVDNLCPGNGEATRTRFADDGRTVKLELVGGSDETVAHRSYYYDGAHLRLAVTHLSQDLGCVVTETRHYFDANGAPLIAVTRKASGAAPEGFDACELSRELAKAPDALETETVEPLLVSSPDDAYDIEITKPVCEG